MLSDIKGAQGTRQSDGCDDYSGRRLLHRCEVCGKEEWLTPRQGFEQGWDYAPYMYPFKVLSPRTCENCGIENTAYFALAILRLPFEQLSDRQKETVRRISGEPESVLPKE